MNRSNAFSGLGNFLFKDKDFIENLTVLDYNILDYSTPVISLGSITIQRNGEQTQKPGDRTFEEGVSLRFIIDENLDVLDNLIMIQEKQSIEKNADIFTIKIMNNKHQFIKQGVYEGFFITNISPLMYSTTSEETSMFVDVSISYRKFKLERIS